MMRIINLIKLLIVFKYWGINWGFCIERVFNRCGWVSCGFEMFYVYTLCNFNFIGKEKCL